MKWIENHNACACLCLHFLTIFIFPRYYMLCLQKASGKKLRGRLGQFINSILRLQTTKWPEIGLEGLSRFCFPCSVGDKFYYEQFWEIKLPRETILKPKFLPGQAKFGLFSLRRIEIRTDPDEFPARKDQSGKTFSPVSRLLIQSPNFFRVESVLNSSRRSGPEARPPRSSAEAPAEAGEKTPAKP